MKDKIYIGIIAVLVGIIIYLYSNTNKIKYQQRLVYDTTIVYLPSDTIKLTELKTQKVYIDKEIKDYDSLKITQSLLRKIDSLNNVLSTIGINRIAEIDTTFLPYNDRINIQYLINKDLWNINMYYNQRQLKVPEKIIYLKEEKEMSDLEKIISENPYISIILSSIVGYGIGRSL